jgi:hypothetical protein
MDKEIVTHTHTHTLKFYSAFKRKGFVTVWMSSEISEGIYIFNVYTQRES